MTDQPLSQQTRDNWQAAIDRKQDTLEPAHTGDLLDINPNLDQAQLNNLHYEDDTDHLNNALSILIGQKSLPADDSCPLSRIPDDYEDRSILTRENCTNTPRDCDSYKINILNTTAIIQYCFDQIKRNDNNFHWGDVPLSDDIGLIWFQVVLLKLRHCNSRFNTMKHAYRLLT